MLAVCFFVFLICSHTRTYSRHSVSTHLQCQNVGQLFCCFGSSSSRATRTFEDALALPLHLSACICFYPSPFTSIFPSLTPSLSLHHLYLSLSLSAFSSAWALLARAHSARCCLGPRLVCATPPLTCTFAACLLSPSASYGFKRGRRLVVRHAAPPQINQQHVARCDSSIASGSPRRGRFCFIFAIYNIYRYIYMNI